MSTSVLLTVIGLLILLNGVFAAMEIALVSVPRARLKRYEKEKKPGARTAMRLQKDIDAFFATVQVGVTFIATLSSAMGGASAVELFGPMLEFVGIAPDSTIGHVLSILAISVSIAYVSLIIGELAPKSLARRYPGTVSVSLAKPFAVFSRVFKPVVWFLTASTRTVLRVFGIKPEQKTQGLTPEELRMMANELVETRQMSTDVYDMLVRVTRLSNIRVEDIMIPRHKIVAVKAESRSDPLLREKILKAFKKYHYSTYPILDKKSENVLGIVNVKDLLTQEDQRKIAQVIRLPNFTARGRSLDKVLAEMQRIDEQLSVVIDEHGIIDGIICLEDILEELIGELKGELPKLVEEVPKEATGVIIVDGLITIHELREQYSISLPPSFYYSTVAGFVLDKLGKIPKAGEHLRFENWDFEVISMDRNRIKDLRISKLPE